MGFVKEFKEFAIKGNVMDLAVGVIIGGAFGKIIDSVVNDLIMPLVAGIIGKPDFSNLYLVLRGAVPEGTALADAKKIEGAAIFAYGNFITVAINFILLALVIFMMIKAINKMKRKEEAVAAAPVAPPKEEMLLTEIRDLLKAKS
ncbi:MULTISPECIES: large conductance mechanosensitive channel protein MscL [unclassified Pedobacter]|uniref:large conductance mechanosensitive channel protein MscL n=1 Tax=Pedobacter TaxID=84567 RepID=UPI000B4BF2AA|nr:MULTISPECIES: large conductance mechanosensitive channel protein MscL [unclassified Pedobacter]MCX2429719.1 large conductance mechanosensitive channel protein MscL [Pedobacter sp. GR22-10]MCX2585371.1 large conductance mechanosensitive channel protein MscL [Pedobacter sp. MR22-3]OWK70808.1 large-conductance mechanosensitive channel protein [Pedobacter sp. AJM]